ncbi:MAG: DNA translocase FtsK [Candidatus Aminicenantes bacterium]|nr:DNA translocase FtsK [Candidatus Aminicenantes bacterium]
MNKSKKTAQSGPRARQFKKKREFGSEIAGVIFLFIGLIFLLSLVSYNAQDPSWAHAASSGQKIHNFVGKAGASISEAFLQVLGLTAFILTFAFFYLGIQLVRTKENPHPALRIIRIFFLLLLLSSLFAIVFGRISWRGADIPAGGLTGDLCVSFLTRIFNHIGTVLILIVLLILFILFTTHLSVKKITLALSWPFEFSFQKVRIQISHYQKAKNREKKRRKVMEKHLGPKKEDLKLRKEKKSKSKGKDRKTAVVITPKKPPAQKNLPFKDPQKRDGYQFPPFSLLDKSKTAEQIDKNELFEKKQLIEEKLQQFGVTGEVRQYHPGPIITTYEFFPDAGIKVNQVANLAEEVSLALAAISVRIHRIAGKSSLGIEVPNNQKEFIKIRDVIESREFQDSESKLTYALGKTVHGEVFITDLTKMPHLLVAGATGTGKSVALNALIASILYKATPEEVKLILIDPKRIELSIYEGIPHLLCPVLKEANKAQAVLLDAIKKMEKRYKKLGMYNVRNIQQYNQMVKNIREDRRRKMTEEELEQLKPIPYIVIIIDEIAELMMAGKKDINFCISRLAQLARAVGIHLVMATQRPSIDIITGTIKSNFSSRIAFRVPTKIDSRVIIDTIGADKLLGDGDMLFIPPNYPKVTRLHGSFITPSEVNRLIRFVKDQGAPLYDDRLIEVINKPLIALKEEEIDKDPMFEKAVELVLLTGQASTSYLQRKLRLGYARAARIVDQMEQEGILGPVDGSKPREILVDPQAYLRKIRDNEEI